MELDLDQLGDVAGGHGGDNGCWIGAGGGDGGYEGPGGGDGGYGPGGGGGCDDEGPG